MKDIRDMTAMELKRSIVGLDEPTEEKRGKGTEFERVRRITGYLTGTLSTWNSAKRSEEHDRVKHA